MSENKLRNFNYKVISSLLIICIIPVTILFGVYFLDNRKYYFISFLIITYSMVPFFILFEKRKPQAREVVIIAVITAIAVGGRAAFFMIPQFKPVIAIVIIAGINLGAECGFLIGALTGLVSNFFFGQGPWTPWQMFGFGIIGLLAGIIFKSKNKKSKLWVCIYGGISTFFIYGFIMNLSYLFNFTHDFSWKALIAFFAAGFWFDLVHAASTVIFLFFIYNSMSEKLNRINTKYGIFNRPSRVEQ